MIKEFRWETQMANRKNRKGRAIGGMVIGVRNGEKVIEEAEEKWRIVGVYANRGVKEK